MQGRPRNGWPRVDSAAVRAKHQLEPSETSASARSSVVLPDPLGPIGATRSPVSTSSEAGCRGRLAGTVTPAPRALKLTGAEATVTGRTY